MMEETKEAFQESMMFVIAGIAGGLVVSLITDARIEERWGDLKYIVNPIAAGFFLTISFIGYLLIKQSKDKRISERRKN